jgi:hypothetical protein
MLGSSSPSTHANGFRPSDVAMRLDSGRFFQSAVHRNEGGCPKHPRGAIDAAVPAVFGSEWKWRVGARPGLTGHGYSR